MLKFMVGVLLAVSVISYSDGIKRYAVDSGARDKVVLYLNSW